MEIFFLEDTLDLDYDTFEESYQVNVNVFAAKLLVRTLKR